jgi:hypothetical protein
VAVIARLLPARLCCRHGAALVRPLVLLYEADVRAKPARIGSRFDDAADCEAAPEFAPRSGRFD